MLISKDQWVLITALSGNSSVSNLQKDMGLQTKALLSKLSKTGHCLLPVCEPGESPGMHSFESRLVELINFN